jgi:uracil-DNA glycosylase
MVIAKDFAPVKKFIQYGGWPGSDVKTNKRLSYYLTYAGFSVGSISEGHDASGLFFTNAVLCLPGGEHMRTYVKTTDVKMCSRKFLCQLISLVNPKSIAALGEHATNAVFEAVGLEQPLSFSNLISEDEGYQLPSGPRLFAVWHPVASNSSKRPITSKDHIAAWSRIGNWLKAND